MDDKLAIYPPSSGKVGEMVLLHSLLLLCLPLGSLAGPLDFLFGNADQTGKRATEPAVLDLPYGSFKSEYNEGSDMLVAPSVVPERD